MYTIPYIKYKNNYNEYQRINTLNFRRVHYPNIENIIYSGRRYIKKNN
jgi:hypothetical protein